MANKNLRHSLFCRVIKHEKWTDYLFITYPNGKLLYCNLDLHSVTVIKHSVLTRKEVPMTAK
jgi:hypothetical protein